MRNAITRLLSASCFATIAIHDVSAGITGDIACSSRVSSAAKKVLCSTFWPMATRKTKPEMAKPVLLLAALSVSVRPMHHSLPIHRMSL